MIFDHLMYDLWGLLPDLFMDYPFKNAFSQGIYRFAMNYWDSGIRIAFRYIIIFIFLSLTGICSSFSRSNLKRGFKLLVVAYTLTVVTYLGGLIIKDKDFMISFGVLHCIAFALIITGLLDKISSKLKDNKWIFLIIGLIMTGIGIYFEGHYKIESYENNNFFLLTLKQMVGMSVCGGDCFPFLFFGGQVFIGVFLGKLLYKNKKSLFNFKYHNDPLTFTGRHSLVVYFAHQIIIPALLILSLLISGFTLYK